MDEELPIYGRKLFSWKVKEREYYQHSKRWFLVFGLLGLAGLIFAVFTSNYLFALIILIIAFIIVFNENEEPEMLDFIIGTEGIMLGHKFYDYDEFKSFSVLYKPAQGLKSLYLDFASPWRRDLMIPLLDNNPLPIRENLLKYIKEDLERTDESLDEILSKLLKL